jgi:Asp-tRNA(Asn)/Glu-tRNA(Gln) amidotransferase A subunit family amidase
LLKEEAIGRKGNDEMGSPKTKAEDVEAAAKWLEIKLKPGNSEKEIAGGKYRGPLHGIPIAIKDIYDIKGGKTTACSKVRENHVSDQDCTVVRKFREAGAGRRRLERIEKRNRTI